MKTVLILVLLFSPMAFAVELKYLNQTTIAHKMKFQKTSIGGLSGLIWDSEGLTAVCDDRGNVNEPRFYQFTAKVSEKEFSVQPKAVTFLTFNKGPLAHQSTKSKASEFSKVIDMEAIALAPWGDFLVSNEGDMNHKPRLNPQILSVKPDGEIQREFLLPSKFLAEISGEQKKGMQNNLAFEAFAANPNGKQWLAGAEGALLQDARGYSRFLELTMPEPFVLKPGKEWAYPLGAGEALVRGVSDFVFLDEKHLLVLERALTVGKEGLGFEVEIYLVDLSQGSDISDLEKIPKEGLPANIKPLEKKLVLNLKTLTDQLGKLENYEGMTIGPKLSSGQRTLILVSDDNFMRDLRTKFLLFSIVP